TLAYEDLPGVYSAGVVPCIGKGGYDPPPVFTALV
ncbi:hypothetical protein Tco_0555096, partial [Tanacetum coccineum]